MVQSSRQDGAWSGLRVIAVLLVLAASAAAQTTSTIEGTVSDASGAVIPGAEVNVRGETISAERRAATDAKGFYRVTALPAGIYTVTVTFSGLSPNAATLDVTLNRVVTFDVTMQVGGVQETVAVSVPALDPSTSATGRPLRRERSRSCPSTAATTSTSAAGAGRRHQPAGRSEQRPIQSGAGRAERQQQFPDRRSVEQGHGERRAGAAVQPGNDRRVSGVDERLQGGVRAGVGRDRQRHHQERRQPVQRRRLDLPPR